ncbi:hypothetical protein GQ457_01G013340 [Hibiscus cannabinus]
MVGVQGRSHLVWYGYSCNYIGHGYLHGNLVIVSGKVTCRYTCIRKSSPSFLPEDLILLQIITIDSGIATISKIFIQPPETLDTLNPRRTNTRNIPVIDLKGINSESHHPEIVVQIKKAANECGFFPSNQPLNPRNSVRRNDPSSQIIPRAIGGKQGILLFL